MKIRHLTARFFYATSFVVLLSGTAGCSFGPEDSSRIIPASQQRNLGNIVVSPSAGTGIGRMYLQRTDNAGGTYLTNVQRNISSDPAEVIGVLLNGPTSAEQDQGLRSAIPGSTKILSARYVATDLVRLDLSSGIFEATGEDLVSSIAQIVLTLCENSDVERVIIVVDGQLNEWPKGDGSLTSQPLTVFDFPGRVISSQPSFPAIIDTLDNT